MVATVLSIGACAAPERVVTLGPSATVAPTLSTTTPSPAPSATPGPTRSQVGDWTIHACTKEPARGSDTDLRPATISAAPGRYDVEAQAGRLTVVRGPDLTLDSGELLSASPPELYMGFDLKTTRVADGTVVAKTSVGLLTDKGGGRSTA